MAFELNTFLIQFLVIVGGAAIFRRFARWVHQPGVVGELVFGLMLGPSLLGLVWPQGYDLFFPAVNRPLIEALGWIGLILFIYTVGGELQWTPSESKPILFIAMGGLLTPFILGSVLALAAPQWFFPRGVASFEGMILMGVVMSVSALAVLGRILADLNLLGSRIGAITLGSSTIDDVVAWVLLGLIGGGAAVGLLGDFNLNLLLVALFFGLVIVVDRYLTPYFKQQMGKHNPVLFVVLLLAIFASALITHEAGLHAVLGPFAVGAIISRHPTIKEYAQTRLGETTNALFLPAFFVLAGMSVDLTILPYPEGLVALFATIAVATLSKLSGAIFGGRAAGLDFATSMQIGSLLNARGAVGLVVAQVGFTAGLLSNSGFAVLVVMIAATTFLTPFVYAIQRGKRAPVAAPTP
ncbi:MAG TPA: cation:proton antiporter [Candidatus Thermoplasmatota archaeon]